MCMMWTVEFIATLSTITIKNLTCQLVYYVVRWLLLKHILYIG